MKLLRYSLILYLFILCACGPSSPPSHKYIFNWNEIKDQDTQTSVFSFCQKQQIDTVFQGYHKPDSIEQHENLLKSANNSNIDLYYVIGNQDDAYQKNLSRLLNDVKTIIEETKQCQQSSVMKGIVFDIEPYLLEEWNDKKTQIIDEFVANMKDVYSYMQDQKLELILCIPYYYDDLGFSTHLQSLVQHTCDGIAIMNYYRKNEAKHISYEVSLCKQYNKKCINIYEFKKAGEHDLQDINTYHNEGIIKAEENFKKIQSEFKNSDITLAIHDLDALREVIESE